MSKDERDEKDVGKRDEKEEKDLQKREEKSVEEKWQRDPLASLVWAAILIWAGIVLLASNLGAFDLIEQFSERLPFGARDLPFDLSFFPIEAWTVFWLGAAGIVFIEIIVRLLVPKYRRTITSTIIAMFILLAIGFWRWEFIFPLILVAIGVSILLRGFRRDQGKEE